MGGAESTAALHVDIEQHNLACGEEIRGVVYLLVKAPTPATELVVYFKGKEKTHWTVQRREKDLIGNGHHNVTYHYSGHKDVIKHRFPIFVFTEQVLQPGQFSFPFAIRTPEHVPSSFEYNSDSSFLSSESTKASISYKLVAKVEGHDSKVDKAKTHVHLTRPFVLGTEPMQGEKTAVISTWCCIKKGQVKVKANFNRDSFQPGDTAVVTVDVNNEESQLPGTAIVARVTRVIRLKDSSIHSTTVTSNVSETRLAEAVAAGKHPAANTQKTLQVTIPNDSSVAKCASVHGSLIECEYLLSGEIEMDGCCMCCGDAPRITKSMTIYPPQLIKAPPPQAPGDWNPMVMPPAQFVATMDSSPPRPSAPVAS